MLKGTIVRQEIRRCTDNLECKSNTLCDEAKNHGNVKDCEVECCEGELCNREGPVARHIVSDPIFPKGKFYQVIKCHRLNT